MKEGYILVNGKKYGLNEDIPGEEIKNCCCITKVEFLTLKEIKERYGEL